MLLLLKFWKPLAVAVMVIGLVTAGFVKGKAHVQRQWDAERATLALAAANQAQQQAVATVVEVIKYVDKIKVVQGKTQTIIKEVPKYVTIQADADCVINAGFVRVHDYAAANTAPDGPRDTDAATTTLKLSTVAETVAENYGICGENSAQLVALQSWIKAMAEVPDGR